MTRFDILVGMKINKTEFKKLLICLSFALRSTQQPSAIGLVTRQLGLHVPRI